MKKQRTKQLENKTVNNGLNGDYSGKCSRLSKFQKLDGFLLKVLVPVTFVLILNKLAPEMYNISGKQLSYHSLYDFNKARGRIL